MNRTDLANRLRKKYPEHFRKGKTLHDTMVILNEVFDEIEEELMYGGGVVLFYDLGVMKVIDVKSRCRRSFQTGELYMDDAKKDIKFYLSKAARRRLNGIPESSKKKVNR